MEKEWVEEGKVKGKWAKMQVGIKWDRKQRGGRGQNVLGGRGGEERSGAGMECCSMQVNRKKQRNTKLRVIVEGKSCGQVRGRPGERRR